MEERVVREREREARDREREREREEKEERGQEAMESKAREEGIRVGGTLDGGADWRR